MNLSAGILTEIYEISIIICAQITWKKHQCIVFVNIQLFKFRVNSQFAIFIIFFAKNLTESAKSLQIAMYLFDKFGKMAAIDLNILIN